MIYPPVGDEPEPLFGHLTRRIKWVTWVMEVIHHFKQAGCTGVEVVNVLKNTKLKLKMPRKGTKSVMVPGEHVPRLWRVGEAPMAQTTTMHPSIHPSIQAGRQKYILCSTRVANAPTSTETCPMHARFWLDSDARG